MEHEATDCPDILGLTRELCVPPAGVVCPANEALFDRIAQELPIRLHRYPSGDAFNGWQVPQSWTVRRAILSRGGRVLFDGTQHALGVARYSKSFEGRLDWNELKTHLVTIPEQPDAYRFHCEWQYRPWAADWAMSLPFAIYQTLTPDTYDVDLVTVYEPGEMLVADWELPGRSEQTIVFNAHTCHPHMANDGFAGVALLIRLVQWLRERDNYYTYRVVFGPEHLGTVFYLRDRPVDELNRLVCGVFAEMPGTTGPIKLASTFLGNQPIDRALRLAARHHGRGYVMVPWRCGAGNDETVWEAPGSEVPFVELTRCLDQFAPFPEYHTSLDTTERLDPGQVNDFYRVLQQAVLTLESDSRLYRTFDGLICLSNPAYDLYLERPDPAMVKDLAQDAEKWGHLLDCLFRYLDGSMTILDIAEKHDLPYGRLLRYLTRFQDKGLVRFEFAPIVRRPVTRATGRSLGVGGQAA